MKKEQIITCNEEIVSGMPVFAGPRVPVAILIDYLKVGDSLERFLEGFPTVTACTSHRFFELDAGSCPDGETKRVRCLMRTKCFLQTKEVT